MKSALKCLRADDSEDLPIIIEIVDTREKLEKFLAVIDGAIDEGLATFEKAQVRFYRSGKLEK